MTVKAEKKEKIREEATPHTRERYYSQYLRSITLPYSVKGDQILATFENGVLEMTLPKAEEVKDQKIEIKAQATKGGTKKRQRKPRQKKS